MEINVDIFGLQHRVVNIDKQGREQGEGVKRRCSLPCE